MSPLLWLQRLFVPKPEEDGEPQEGLQDFENSPLVSGQHLRILIAIAVVFLSAMVMWWILI